MINDIPIITDMHILVGCVELGERRAEVHHQYSIHHTNGFDFHHSVTINDDIQDYPHQGGSDFPYERLHHR